MLLWNFGCPMFNDSNKAKLWLGASWKVCACFATDGLVLLNPKKNESQARSSSAASPKRTIWIVHNILEITRIVETTNQLVVHETKAPELHLQLSNCTSNLTSGGWGTCPACLVLVIKPKYPKSNQKADLERDPPLLHLSIPASSCHSHIPQGQQKPLCPATIAGIWFGSWWWSFLADISGATPALT